MDPNQLSRDGGHKTFTYSESRNLIQNETPTWVTRRGEEPNQSQNSSFDSFGAAPPKLLKPNPDPPPNPPPPPCASGIRLGRAPQPPEGLECLRQGAADGAQGTRERRALPGRPPPHSKQKTNKPTGLKNKQKTHRINIKNQNESKYSTPKFYGIEFIIVHHTPFHLPQATKS